MSDEDKIVSLADRRAAAQAQAEAQRREQARQQASARARVGGGGSGGGGGGDGQPTPWVTYTILGLNVLVWLVMVGVGVSASDPTPAELVPWGGSAAPLLFLGGWWRLLTSMFLHGGIMHLAFNMYFLWQLGPTSERIFSPWPYALIYAGSGLIGGLVSAAWTPDAVIVGASGALFGVFGAFLAFTIRRRESLPEEHVKSVQRTALIFIGLSLAMGIAAEGISLSAHLGGLNAGLGIGYLLTRLGEQPVSTAEEALALRRRGTALATMITTAVVAIGVAGLYYYLSVFVFEVL